jgi:ketosteroid isomerase-like protein
MKISKFSKMASFVVIGAVAAKSMLTGKKGGPSAKVAMATKAVGEANARFRDHVRLGRPSDMASLYTDEAVLLPPHHEIVRGRGAVEAYWRAALEAGIKDIALTTVDVDVFGDRIREVGTYALKVWPEGKAAWEDSGKYLVIWRKQADGSVKLDADIWNTTLPPGT